MGQECSHDHEWCVLDTLCSEQDEVKTHAEKNADVLHTYVHIENKELRMNLPIEELGL